MRDVRHARKEQSSWQKFLTRVAFIFLPDESNRRSLAHAESYELLPAQTDAGSSADWSTKQRPKRRYCNTIGVIVAVVLALVLVAFGILHIVIVLLGHVGFFGPLSIWNLAQPVAPYPGYYKTSLRNTTQDVVPIACHSHNDYWRNVPLFDAIHAGCTSVEADIWLLPESDELYVGHSRSSLSKDRTLRTLYINPLLGLLDGSNSSGQDDTVVTKGIFDMDPKQTLVLLLDFKTDGQLTLPAVQRHLDSLRKLHCLSFWDGGSFVFRAITIVFSGNMPEDIPTQTADYRDIFLDAPLEQLWEPPENLDTMPAELQASVRSRKATTPTSFWNVSNSYYASTSFNAAVGQPWMGLFTSKQMETIRGHVRGARKRGLKVRYWDTPQWPISRRNKIWQMLLDEGADILSVDDIYSVAFLNWNRVMHTWFNG